jgi:hypothetical protein
MTLKNLQTAIRNEIEQQSFFMETRNSYNQYIPIQVFERYISLIYGVGFDEGRKYVCNKKPVEQIKNGTIIKIWESQTAAANALNFNHSGISKCITGERKKYQGFEWHEKSQV